MEYSPIDEGDSGKSHNCLQKSHISQLYAPLYLHILVNSVISVSSITIASLLRLCFFMLCWKGTTIDILNINLKLYLCYDTLCSGEPSPALPVDLFEKVNVKVDGAVEDCEKVAEASGVLHPGGPVG